MKTYSSRPGHSENARVVPCPLCGSRRFRDKWRTGDYAYVRCLDCRAIYQNPQTPQEQIIHRYDEAYADYERENEEAFLNLMLLGLKDMKFHDWEEETRAMGPVLDVGCATGALLSWLRERGWRTEGLEVCPPSREIARNERGLVVHGLPLEQADLPRESYSFVHSSHVIEHVNDPVSFVGQIHRILKPGGYFLCVTPNTAALQPLVFRGGWRSAIADHLILFSRRRLISLLHKKGFTLVRTKTWGGMAAGTVPRPVKKIMDKGAKLLYFGDVVALLARKPL